jgi:ubiquinone/menaquinone biosynthesis C-methylase UbiE
MEKHTPEAMKATPDKDRPSLENLVETFDLGAEVLHPGGPQTTTELAELCYIRSKTRVLDVASGTGEGLCFLVDTFHCQAVRRGFSEAMVRRAQRKAHERSLAIDFQQGDAHRLSFDADVSTW